MSAAAQVAPAHEPQTAPRSEGAIVVTDAAALRARPATGGLVRLLRQARVLPPIEHAWKELAATMGIDESAAFDRLLGRRVAVFFERPQDAGAMEWAIASQVDPATEQLVRERLKPSPRGFIAGAPVLSLENGAFELAVPQSKDGARGLPTLVLSPRGGTLLERLVPSGATPPAPPARVGAARDARGDVFAVYREPSGGAIPSFASATAWAEGSRWRVAYSGSRALLVGAGADDPHTPPAALGDVNAWNTLTQGAALAFIGQARPEITGAGTLVTISHQLIGDSPLPEAAGTSVALVLREPVGVGGWTLSLALPVAVSAEPGDAALSAGAQRGDGAIAHALGAISVHGGEGVDFKGRWPGAIRTASPSSQRADQSSPAASDRSATLLSRTSWAWTYARASGADRAWWIVTICGPVADADQGESLAAAGVVAMRRAIIGDAPNWSAPDRSGPPGSDASRLAAPPAVPDVFRFSARPDALARGLVQIGLPEVGLVAALKEAQAIDWRCRSGAPGLVEGELTLEMRTVAQE